jgi:hypothetical protein
MGESGFYEANLAGGRGLLRGFAERTLPRIVAVCSVLRNELGRRILFFFAFTERT